MSSIKILLYKKIVGIKQILIQSQNIDTLQCIWCICVISLCTPVLILHHHISKSHCVCSISSTNTCQSHHMCTQYTVHITQYFMSVISVNFQDFTKEQNYYAKNNVSRQKLISYSIKGFSSIQTLSTMYILYRINHDEIRYEI